jgi:hypothetical protein
MKMIFVIYSFNYSCNSGGITVLHKLGKILTDLGNIVYLIANNTIEDSKCNLISIEQAKILCKQKDVITIYPEVVPGNILNATNVIRWVLNTPGILGKGNKTFNKNEKIFAYSDYFVRDTIYKDAPLLFVIDTKIDKFKDMNLQRKGDAVLIKKGEAHLKKVNLVSPITHIDNIIAINKDLDNKLLKIFNEKKRLISFDINTYHSIQAALCGCISIVIPIKGISKEDWLKQDTLKYGVAYGFDDIERALETLPLLKKHLNDLENKSLETINKFLNLIKL